MSANFKNEGNYARATLFQGSKIYNIYGKSASVSAPAPQELEAGKGRLAGLPVEEIPEPAPVPNGSYIPVRRNSLFVGRAADLIRMAALMKAGEVAAVTGLGGIGKTQLAAEFVHRYGQFFAGGVFWLNCSRAQDLPSQVVQCGGARGMALRESFDELSQPQQVALVQGTWSNALPRLLDLVRLLVSEAPNLANIGSLKLLWDLCKHVVPISPPTRAVARGGFVHRPAHKRADLLFLFSQLGQFGLAGADLHL